MSKIKVLSSLATKEAYLELVPQFEKATGHTIATTWAGTVDIMKRMAAGEIYDLLIASSAAIDELIKLGKVAPGSRTDMARTGIGIAVRPEAKVAANRISQNTIAGNGLPIMRCSAGGFLKSCPKVALSNEP